MFRVVAASVVLAAATARAEPAVSVVDTPKPASHRVAPPDPSSDDDVAHAPLPGAESGRTDPVGDDDNTAREVGRIALTPLRWTVGILLSPVHEVVTVWGRHRLSHQVGGLGDPKGVAVGIQPLLHVDGGELTGVAGGGRITLDNVLGEHEQIAALAAGGVGGYIRQLYDVSLGSGTRFGKHFSLSLDGRYEDRPRDGFHGFGNTAQPVERFGQRRAATELVGDVRLSDELHVRPGVALVDDRFTSPIDGMTQSTSQANAALELRWSSEHPAGEWDPKWLPTTGTLVAVAGERAHRLDGGADFWRARVDAEQLLRLGIGPRLLAFRLHAEQVSAGRDDVPLPELPTLGGPRLLRGYALDEFRDRVAAVATIDYRWDLAQGMGAHVFVDAGRVAPALDDLALSGVHVGYGAGILIGPRDAALEIASGVDGGVVLTLDIGALPSTVTGAR